MCVLGSLPVFLSGELNDPLVVLRDIWDKMKGRRVCDGNFVRPQAEIASLQSLIFEFEAGMTRYPTQAEGLDVLVSGADSEEGLCSRNLLKSFPNDPWGRPFQYRIPATRSKQPFEVFSLGPDGVVSGDDIGNW